MVIAFQEDLIICEYCDEGVHYTCLSPRPEKRPKVWDCDDCLVARGKPPNNNIKKRSGATTNHPSLNFNTAFSAASTAEDSDNNMPSLQPEVDVGGGGGGRADSAASVSIKIDSPSVSYYNISVNCVTKPSLPLSKSPEYQSVVDLELF